MNINNIIEHFEAMFTSLKILCYMPLFYFDNINIILFTERNDQPHICFCSGINLKLRNMKMTGIGTEILYR